MRSPAANLIQADGGQGRLTVYAAEGFVMTHLGPVTLKLTPDQAVWLSNELLSKATLVGAVLDRKGA